MKYMLTTLLTADINKAPLEEVCNCAILDEDQIPAIMSLDIPKGVGKSKTRQVPETFFLNDMYVPSHRIYTLTRIK